jgi:hypothetical protein
MLKVARAITAFNGDVHEDIFKSSHLPIPECENMVNEQQIKEINIYLEEAYVGAKMFADQECMLRTARAIYAFNADIHLDIFKASHIPIPEV